MEQILSCMFGQIVLFFYTFAQKRSGTVKPLYHSASEFEGTIKILETTYKFLRCKISVICLCGQYRKKGILIQELKRDERILL